MKSLPRWSIPLIFIAVVLGVVGVVSQFAQKSPVFASGQIQIASELEEKAKGIRTLFITVFDGQSESPMPYGAGKFTIEADAQGEFYKFVLTPENLRVMNMAGGAPMPKALRIKARLDRDGVGGPDKPGDLTGEIASVAPGSQGVAIKIERFVE